MKDFLIGAITGAVLFGGLALVYVLRTGGF